MDQYRMVFIQAFTWTPNMQLLSCLVSHRKLIEDVKFCMQKIKLITKTPVELKDNLNILRISHLNAQSDYLRATFMVNVNDSLK